MKLTVFPYKTAFGIWAFDHDHNNTVAEGLLNGTELVIDAYYKSLTGKDPQPGSKMRFDLATEPFPEATTQLNLVRTDENGSDYVDKLTGMDVWLCPWLQGFFGHVPEVIYIKHSLH